MPKQQPRPEPQTPPAPPTLAEDPPRFLLLEREVEIEYRPQMLAALQSKVDAVAQGARHSDALSRYHADSRSSGAPTQAAASAVVLSVDGCSLGMQVRSKRRRRQAGETLPPLPPIEEGHFREVKTGVLLLPSERVETS